MDSECTSKKYRAVLTNTKNNTHYEDERLTKMRKNILWVAMVSIVITGCGASDELQTQNESLSNQVESLTAEKESLSADLESINSDYDKVNQQLTSIKKSIEEAQKETEVQEGDVTVIVTDKGQRPKNINAGQFNDYCTTTFQITNNTDKDIQGIEGRLTIKDLFGKEIMQMGCDFTGQIIPAKQTIINDALVFEVNPYISEHVKFYSTEFKDLIFEYKVSQIVFTDGTIKR